MRGIVVEKDVKKAVEYFKLSAMQGYGFAQNDLGLLYERGEGVSKDLKKLLTTLNLQLIKVIHKVYTI